MHKIKIDYKYVVAYFDIVVKKTIEGEDFDRSNYYCGITNDLERRAKEHNT